MNRHCAGSDHAEKVTAHNTARSRTVSDDREEVGSSRLDESVADFVDSDVEAVPEFAWPKSRRVDRPELSKEWLDAPIASSDFPNLLPTTVCDEDDRVRTGTSTYPWKSICRLFIVRGDGANRVGSGFFIGERCIITAGHVVNTDFGWARQIEVVPGMDGTDRPYGSQTVPGGAGWFRSVNGWIDDKDRDYDYGAIILPDDTLYRSVRAYFGFQIRSSDELLDMTANNSGYPTDRDTNAQYFNADPISAVETRRLRYMIDTHGGQSGSPVWRFADGSRYVVGVHTTGDCPNGATRVSRSVFDNLQDWKAEGQ